MPGKELVQEFGNLFYHMSFIALSFLVAGLIICAMEIFYRSGKILGFLGGISIVIGITLRMLNNGNVIILSYLVLIVVVIIYSLFVFSVFSRKMGWLLREPPGGMSFIPQKEDVIDVETKDYFFLLNLMGDAVSDIDSSGGNVLINNIDFEVMTRLSPIKAGTKVKVVEVDGKSIYVKEIVSQQ